MSTGDSIDDIDSIWPLLADSYSEIEAAWRELAQSSQSDLAADVARTVHDAKEVSPKSDILIIGEMSGLMAGMTIGGHLNLLSRAYWPPRTGHDFTPVDQPAIYPPARAALEAASIISWACNHKSEPELRELRAAELWLWSAINGITSSPDHAVDTIVAAGYTIEYSRRGRRRPLLIVNGKPQQLSVGRMIREMLGEISQSMYADWSSMSHSDPFHIYDSVEKVGSGEGFVEVALKVEPVYHVLTGGMVAQAVSVAGERYGTFWDRDFTSVATQCDSLFREMVRIIATIPSPFKSMVEAVLAGSHEDEWAGRIDT